MATVQADIYTYGTVELERWDAELPVANETASKTQWFPVRAMCRILGVDEEKQVAIVKEAYPDALREVPLQLPKVGWRMPLCIKRKEMALWVAGIDPKRCKLAVRGPLEEFRRELLDAADRLFWRRSDRASVQGVRAAAADPGTVITLEGAQRGEILCECGRVHVFEIANGEVRVWHR